MSNSLDKQTAEKYGNRVHSLYNATQKGSAHINNIPHLIKQVIEDQMWLHFIHPSDGQLYENVSIVDFIKSTPLKGLGTDPETLISILQTRARGKNDEDAQVAREALDLLAQNLSRQGARIDSANIHDNIMEVPVLKQGTSTVYALRRLKRDRPDLHERVVDGELSAHKAMIEAGFRKQRFSIPQDDIGSAAKAIRNRLSDNQVKELIEELQRDNS